MKKINHFFAKKLTNSVLKKAVKKIEKDATEKVGAEKAKQISDNLKKGMEDPIFKKKLKEVNTIGDVTIITSAVLGAGAIAGVGAGAGGAGAAVTGTGTAASGTGTAGAIGAAGTGLSLVDKKDRTPEKDLYKKGIVPGDQGKELIDQLLDNQIVQDKSRELLDRMIEGNEDTGVSSGSDLSLNLGKSENRTLGNMFPAPDGIFIIVIIAIVLLLFMKK